MKLDSIKNYYWGIKVCWNDVCHMYDTEDRHSCTLVKPDNVKVFRHGNWYLSGLL